MFKLGLKAWCIILGEGGWLCKVDATTENKLDKTVSEAKFLKSLTTADKGHIYIYLFPINYGLLESRTWFDYPLKSQENELDLERNWNGYI